MSLDVYVMPLWRFRAGLFESPLERHFGRDNVSVISVFGQQLRGLPGKVAARRFVRKVCRAVKSKTGHRPFWCDEGEMAYGEQASLGFERLRAFALWTGVRDVLPNFDHPEDDNYYSHPVWKLTKGASAEFPQLTAHSCHTGFFLPDDFEPVCHVLPQKFRIWTFYTSVGSSPRLIQELERLRPHLGTSLEFDPEDRLCRVKECYLQLREVTELSLRHGLPIIFCG